MKAQRRRVQGKLVAAAMTVLVGAGVGSGIYAKGHRGDGGAGQETEATREKNAQSTTLSDQTDLNVTVYNSNIALVRDVRQLTLPSGMFSLKFADIAATVNPATVHFRSLTEPDKLSVIEQNYEYDLLEPAKLLNKYVGKEVTLVRTSRENGELKHEDVKATLLADNNGPVWKIGNDIVTGVYAEGYRFPEVPANLFERPTLLMSLENNGGRKQQIEASYLAGNLSWNADYILTVGREDKTADLDGWVTLGNTSGTAFHNARLQLVAGELNRLPQAPRAMEMRADLAMSAKAAAPQFQQESFSEYHLYTLGRRTSIEDKETKQISLLQGTGVPTEKVFIVNGQARALARVFGERLAEIPVCAPKAAVGETLGASGALGAFVAALALSKQCLPPTARFENDEYGLRLSAGVQELRGTYALVNAFGCDGNHAALLLRRLSSEGITE